MTSVHRLEHVDGLTATDLADDDTIGSHTQGVSHQVALADFAFTFNIGRACFQTHAVWLLQLQFGRVFDGDEPLVDFADAVRIVAGTSGSIEEVSDALETLQRHCDDVGRDITTIEKTVSFPVILRDDPGSADARIRELLAHNGVSDEDFGSYFASSPRQIADELRRFLALGFETVIVRMPAPYDRQTIERMREVADLLVD